MRIKRSSEFSLRVYYHLVYFEHKTPCDSA